MTTVRGGVIHSPMGYFGLDCFQLYGLDGALIGYEPLDSSMQLRSPSGGGGALSYSFGYGAWGQTHDHYDWFMSSSFFNQEGAFGNYGSQTFAYSFDDYKSWSPYGTFEQITATVSSSWVQGSFGPGYNVNESHSQGASVTDIHSLNIGHGYLGAFVSHEESGYTSDSFSFASGNFETWQVSGTSQDIRTTHSLDLNAGGVSTTDSYAASNDTFSFDHMKLGALVVDHQSSVHNDVSDILWQNQFGSGEQLELNHSESASTHVELPGYVSNTYDAVDMHEAHMASIAMVPVFDDFHVGKG